MGAPTNHGNTNDKSNNTFSPICSYLALLFESIFGWKNYILFIKEWNLEGTYPPKVSLDDQVEENYLLYFTMRLPVVIIPYNYLQQKKKR